MNTLDFICGKIDAFLARTGMSASALGWEAVHDTRAVANIRKGAASLKTIKRLETYMDNYVAP